MARIALDAMGGDHAPAETVAGAVDAAGRGVDIVLVGDPDILNRELSSHDVVLPIVEALDVIDMGDDPTRALREKPGASITVAARLVKEGSADGLVSAGSTGAAMAAAAIIIGRAKDVSRPAIATIFPTPNSPTLVLDSGANPDVKPEQLAQFGIMGAVAAQALFDVENPRVGLLSNGEEKGKGRALEKAAYNLLEEGPTEFVGNVEGRDIATDRADVIVTDGFTGNIFLKTTEGVAKLVTRYFREAMSDLPDDVQEVALAAIASVQQRLDYETYGGAQLLGVKSVVVIAHGNSSRIAISNALALAKESADHDLAKRIADQLS